MTAAPPPDHDELVSAYLDGAAAPDEIALVEADPALLARVEAFRSLSNDMAAPAPAGDELRRSQISAALGEFDRLIDAGEFGGSSAETAASVTDIRDAHAAAGAREAARPVAASSIPSDVSDTTAAATPARGTAVTSMSEARERRRPKRFNLVVAAAAAVALLFAGVVAVGLNQGEQRDVVDAASDTVEAPAMSSSASDAMADEADAFDEDEAFAAEAGEAAASDAVEEEAAGDADTPADAVAARGAMADEGDDSMAEAEMSIDDAIEVEADEAMADEAPDLGGAAASAPQADAEEAFADPDANDGFQPVMLGVFANLDALADAVDGHVAPDSARSFAAKLSVDIEQAPATCNAALSAASLTSGEVNSLVALAVLDDALVELHAALDETTLVVEPATCTVLATLGG